MIEGVDALKLGIRIVEHSEFAVSERGFAMVLVWTVEGQRNCGSLAKFGRPVISTPMKTKIVRLLLARLCFPKIWLFPNLADPLLTGPIGYDLPIEGGVCGFHKLPVMLENHIGRISHLQSQRRGIEKALGRKGVGVKSKFLDISVVMN